MALVTAGACGSASRSLRTSSALSPQEYAAVSEVFVQAVTAEQEERFVDCARHYTRAASLVRSAGFQRSSHYQAASCHLRAGARDAAFASIERALPLGMHSLDGKVAPYELAALVSDPRWEALRARNLRDQAAAEKSLGAPELRRELLAMELADQDAREKWIAADYPRELGLEVQALDQKHTARLAQIIERHGWPKHSLVGEDGASAAWLLAQHADLEPAFQKRCLALMEPLIALGEVDGADYAYLFDRVAIAEERPQRYGSQFHVDTHEPLPLEDEARVDELRASVGLTSLAVYRLRMQQAYGSK